MVQISIKSPTQAEVKSTCAFKNSHFHYHVVTKRHSYPNHMCSKDQGCQGLRTKTALPTSAFLSASDSYQNSSAYSRAQVIRKKELDSPNTRKHVPPQVHVQIYFYSHFSLNDF